MVTLVRARAESRSLTGRRGSLRYRGIPIEELAEKSTFIEVAHLIIMGRLPNSAELRRFSDLLTENELLNEAMKYHYEGFPPHAHPMAILSSMINAASCFYPELLTEAMRERFDVQSARLLSQVRTIAAFCVPQIARFAGDLSETGFEIHRELPAHDVLAAE